jgi:hypothetical protein
MRNDSEDLHPLISGPMLGVCIATLTILLGWSGHRGYLEWFGIDPAGVDGASAETTVNYVGFGIEVISRSKILLVIYSSGALCYLVYEILREVLPNTQRLPVLKTVRIIISLYVSGALFLAFFQGRGWAEEVGKEFARERLRDPTTNFRPIFITGESVLPAQSGVGCWRKILEDKKNLYVYWQGEDIRPRPSTYVIALDSKIAVRISTNPDCR